MLGLSPCGCAQLVRVCDCTSCANRHGEPAHGGRLGRAGAGLGAAGLRHGAGPAAGRSRGSGAYSRRTCIARAASVMPPDSEG